MFQPDYLERLMEIGEADAEAWQPEMRELMGGREMAPLPRTREAYATVTSSHR